MSKVAAIDTNLIVRFLTNDPPDQAEKVDQFFHRAKAGSLVIPDIIVAEIIYVLLSVYELSKAEIIEKINLLITFSTVRVNGKVLHTALDLFSQHNISFVDAYLLAMAETNQCSKVYSFDKDLKKINKDKIDTPH